jgi:hypothetical protein
MSVTTKQKIVLAIIPAVGAIFVAIIRYGPAWFSPKRGTDVTIAGTVVDLATNLPISGADISVEGKPSGYVTENNGNFRFSFTDTSVDHTVRIRVDKPGYSSWDRSVPTPSEDLTIQLARIPSVSNNSSSSGSGGSNSAGGTSIPPLVEGGAPIGSKFQYSYAKSSLECVGDYVKVSATEWQERQPSPGSSAGCQADAVIFRYTERQSDDPHYIVLYDEGRSLFARLNNTERGQLSPTEWRLVSNQAWNAGRSVTRVN